MGSSDADAEQLLQLYEQLQGKAPADAPPALKVVLRMLGSYLHNNG